VLELVRIIDEYAADAVTALGIQPNSFPSSDREWVLEHAASSLPEIEKATRRLRSIRETGNLNQAAARLGMARVSLHKWIRRRPLPMPVDD
jgi:transcriptional regulator of acetoin/glycerol metabolism